MDLRSNGPHRSVFRSVRSSRSTRAIDLRSNGPHRLAFRPVRSMPASARSNESILAAHFESDGQRRSEQFRRSDLKDESQPLISNLTTLCHPPGKPSGSPFRKPARSTPPSEALSEDATCSRVPNQRTFSRMSCECATRPGAQAETLSGRLSDHPPSAFRTRHLSPSTPGR